MQEKYKEEMDDCPMRHDMKGGGLPPTTVQLTCILSPANNGLWISDKKMSSGLARNRNFRRSFETRITTVLTINVQNYSCS